MNEIDLSAIDRQLLARDRLASLNVVEYEVLCLRLENATVKEIAERLGIEACAVESHGTEIFAKLNVETLLQALNVIDMAARLI